MRLATALVNSADLTAARPLDLGDTRLLVQRVWPEPVEDDDPHADKVWRIRFFRPLGLPYTSPPPWDESFVHYVRTFAAVESFLSQWSLGGDDDENWEPIQE